MLFRSLPIAGWLSSPEWLSASGLVMVLLPQAAKGRRSISISNRILLIGSGDYHPQTIVLAIHRIQEVCNAGY